MTTKKAWRDAPKAQFNVRLPPELLAQLDAWLDEMNADRRMPIARADLVRGVLDWAIEHRPEWEKR